MFEIRKYKDFSKERDRSAFAPVRVSIHIFKKLGGRNNWVKLSSENKHIYRMALGGSGAGFTKDAIQIDYDSCCELGVKPSSVKDEHDFYPCAIKIQKANFFEKIIAHWKHPDPAYRVPMQLGIVGFILGVIGLILGILGFA